MNNQTNFVHFVNSAPEGETVKQADDRMRFLLEAEDHLQRSGRTDTTPEELWTLYQAYS